jgi:hypothetical protein
MRQLRRAPLSRATLTTTAKPTCFMVMPTVGETESVRVRKLSSLLMNPLLS